MSYSPPSAVTFIFGTCPRKRSKMPFKWKRKGRKTCKTVKLFNYKCLNFNDKNGWACEMLPTKNRPSNFY